MDGRPYHYYVCTMIGVLQEGGRQQHPSAVSRSLFFGRPLLRQKPPQRHQWTFIVAAWIEEIGDDDHDPASLVAGLKLPGTSREVRVSAEGLTIFQHDVTKDEDVKSKLNN